MFDPPVPIDLNLYPEEEPEKMSMDMGRGRDPWTLVALAITVLVQIAGWAYYGGKFDQRMLTVEDDVMDLKSKATKDAAQDVQLAVIGVQLTTISSGVGEIKAKLERK